MLADEPEPGFRYLAFISYSHQDSAWGRWLHRALERYRLPQRLIGMPIAAGTIPARLTPVFRDRDELPTATDLDRTVAEALRQSWCLIVICSPASAQSRWVNEEVREFQRLGRAERIHCLIVDGSAGAAAAPCFPPALRERPWQGTVAGEPIAADARRSGDGKTNARLKLVAGILGISFDKLVQRDQQRGYRRMALIAVAAVSALVLLTVFTVITVTSHRDAEAQRSHAEQLVEFMLGDLRQKLEPEGKLSTLDAVGKEALAYYAAQDPARLDADALARRARALHMIGEVYDKRGRLDDALGVFKQAAASTVELLARDKDNAQRIFDHAQSVYWVGLIAFQRGELDVAKPAFEQYRQLAEHLVAIDPNNADWQAEVGYASSNLGTLFLSQGRADEAVSSFQTSLRISRVLSERAPQDTNRRVELAQSLAWLADAFAAQGRLHDAMAQRLEEIGIYEGILGADARNSDATRALAISERSSGILSLALGDVRMSVTQLRRAAELADDIARRDADDVSSAEMTSAIQADFGEALRESGESSAAAMAVARAREVATALVGRDPNVVVWQLRLARSLLLQADTTAATGDAFGALRVVQGVIEHIKAMPAFKHPDRRTRLLLARAYLLAGELQQRLGDTPAAKDAWEQTTALMLPSISNAEPAMKATLAMALNALGRSVEASALCAELVSIDYRAPEYARRVHCSGQSATVSEVNSTVKR